MEGYDSKLIAVIILIIFIFLSFHPKNKTNFNKNSEGNPTNG